MFIFEEIAAVFVLVLVFELTLVLVIMVVIDELWLGLLLLLLLICGKELGLFAVVVITAVRRLFCKGAVFIWLLVLDEDDGEDEEGDDGSCMGMNVYLFCRSLLLLLLLLNLGQANGPWLILLWSAVDVAVVVVVD